jgi:hypothetical protein
MVYGNKKPQQPNTHKNQVKKISTLAKTKTAAEKAADERGRTRGKRLCHYLDYSIINSRSMRASRDQKRP